jgi:hypothetical protein
MQKILAIALILSTACMQAINITNIQNQSDQPVVITDHGPGHAVEVKRFTKQPLTEAELANLEVSRQWLSFPDLTPIGARQNAGPLRVYGAGSITTAQGTVPLGNANIRFLVINPAGAVYADGKLVR